MKNFLRILEISQVNHRNLKFKKLNLTKHLSGHLRLLGEVGSGKTNFIEILRLATEESCKLRDKNINPDGKEKAQFEIRFSDNFYIGFMKTPSGNFQTSLYMKNVDGKKITPINNDGRKINVSDYKSMLTTELSYGVNKFLSDNSIVQFEFLKKIYQLELIKLGLLGDNEDPKTFDYKLKQALNNRNLIQAEQSRAGAYKEHLQEDYNMVCPDFINIAELLNKLNSIKEKIKNCEERIINENIKLVEKYNEDVLISNNDYTKKCSQLENKINELKSQLISYNENLNKTYVVNLKTLENDIVLYNARVERKNALLQNAILGKRYIAQLLNDIVQEGQEKQIPPDIFNVFKETLGQFLNNYKLEEKRNYDIEKINIERGIVIPIDNENLKLFVKENINLPYSQNNVILELMGLYSTLSKITPSSINKPIPIRRLEIKKLAKEELKNKFEKELYDLYINEIDLQNQQNVAKDSNEIWHKFDIYNKFTEADKIVNEIRSEIKKAYSMVKTGVDGMKLTFDEVKDRVVVMYDGRCFGKSKLRELTSFSHTEKRFVAAQLQLYLLKQKAKPLNVIFFDELGMDKKTDKLFTDFAIENGLLIITTSSGDFEAKDMTENEILIENGHLIFADNVEDFTPEEIIKFNKEKDDEKENGKPKKNKIKNKEIPRTEMLKKSKAKKENEDNIFKL